MLKSMGLVCAAMLMFTASAYGMHRAGWFGNQSPIAVDAREAPASDPFQSPEAMRFRQNQNTNWRLITTVR